MSEPNQQSKAKQNFLQMLGDLNSRILARDQAAQVRGEEESDYQQIRSELTTAASEALDRGSADLSDNPDVLDMRWCLSESPEGDFTRIRIFKELEGLCRYLGKLEGEETAAWPFFGTPMRFTKPLPQFHNRRLLLLPGEDEAIILPQSPAEPLKRVPLDLLDDLRKEHFQSNGWMGLPALAENQEEEEEFSQGDVELHKQQEAKKKKDKKDDDDDEDAEEIAP